LPRISEFYGIAIYLYYQDHGPPHFHAIYGEHEATISARLLQGKLPKRLWRLCERGPDCITQSLNTTGLSRGEVIPCNPSRRWSKVDP